MENILAYIIFAALLFGILLRLSWIDIKSYRLPDKLTLPLIVLGWLQSYLLSSSLLASFIGTIIGYTVFVAIEYGFRALRGKDGLGRGDAKLLAAGGAWCGWAALPFIILIASGLGLLAALLFQRRGSKDETPYTVSMIPFGPFLAFGIFTVWIAGLMSS